MQTGVAMKTSTEERKASTEGKGQIIKTFGRMFI